MSSDVEKQFQTDLPVLKDLLLGFSVRTRRLGFGSLLLVEKPNYSRVEIGVF